MAKKEMLCTSCGYRGKPKKTLAGNSGIELILYLCFIIPGLIYSSWRSSSATQGCPECQSNMIPLNSPVARKFLTDLKV